MSNDDFQPKSGVKFGGAHSPGKVDATMRQNPIARLQSAKVFDKSAQRASSGRTRSWLIIFFTLPLVLAGIVEMINGNAFGAMRDFGLFALFCFAATTLRSGLAAEAEYEAREFASAPGLPRKIIGSALLGAGLLLTCWTGWGIGLLQSIGFGVMGTVASLFAFGLDPVKGKGYTTSTGVTPQMVVDAIAEAEEKIEGIERAGAQLKDRPLRDRVNRVTKRSRDILARIEQDPSDLRRSKKFLIVYLDGALEATQKYARTQNDLGGDKDVYIKFRSLLDDMERAFDHQHEKLLTNDRMDLDVEIDVLADRLKAESRL
jgi:5-bromo-4-chloroindolyl phosphate hydrolysis protein